MRNTLLIGLGLFGFAVSALAGPPLVCHPFDIGQAKSLPWASGANWENPDPSYDVKNLGRDTIALLDSGAPVLVRMETMRRAAVYGENNHDAVRTLLARLQQRANSKPDALSLFDYGYMIATIKQIHWKYQEDLTGGVDGYELVAKALALNPDSGEMHYAAALILSDQPGTPRRDEHLRRARAVQGDALLAENIAKSFK